METRYNDEKRTRALKRYHQLRPEVADATAGSEEKGKGKGRNGRRTKGKGVFDVLQYIEETRVSVKVMRDTIKEEMTKQAFELHYMSKGYTAAEALVERDNLMKDPESVDDRLRRTRRARRSSMWRWANARSIGTSSAAAERCREQTGRSATPPRTRSMGCSAGSSSAWSSTAAQASR